MLSSFLIFWLYCDKSLTIVWYPFLYVTSFKGHKKSKAEFGASKFWFTLKTIKIFGPFGLFSKCSWLKIVQNKTLGSLTNVEQKFTPFSQRGGGVSLEIRDPKKPSACSSFNSQPLWISIDKLLDTSMYLRKNQDLNQSFNFQMVNF